MGQVHDNLTGTTTALYNAICDVTEDPSAKNKRELRKMLRKFQKYANYLAYHAHEALEMKRQNG